MNGEELEHMKLSMFWPAAQRALGQAQPVGGTSSFPCNFHSVSYST